MTALAERRNIGLTLAGGGNRAFYQLGLLQHWGDRLWQRTAAIAACSAGACVATMWLSGREAPTRRFWRARRAGVTRNLEWGALLRGRSPAPHGPIYRDTLLCCYSEGGLERIREQPFPILVLAAKFPRGLPAPLAVLLGLGAYNLEKKLDPSLMHPAFGKRLGFRPLVADARQCTTPEELADLVIASSSTPPFTPVGRFRGDALLDGGMIDNVPAFVADQAPGVQRNLVMLTKPYPRHLLGTHGTRLYVAPSKPVPVHRWDYTRPDLVDDTIAMGETEAETHGPRIREFLAF